MVKIYWSPRLGLNLEESSSIQAPRPASLSTGEDTSQGLSKDDSRLVLPALQLIDSRLRAFDKALSSFKWPNTDFPMFQAKLVIRDPDLEGKVRGELPEADQVTRYYKYFSKGLRGDQEVGLDPGDYTFALSLGSTSDSFTVAIEDGTTNEELVAAVAAGVNASAIKARGHHITQSGKGLAVPGLNKTGHILGLSVNNAYEDQDLSITGTSAALKNYLGLEATQLPTTPATADRYDVTVKSAYSPSTFYTASFDPNADPGLATGVYDFTLTLGNQSQDVQVGVGNEDTWRDVLNSMANAIGGSGLATAEVVATPRRSDLVTDPAYYLMTEGVSLKIQALEPKVGERLSLSGGDHAGNGAFEVFSLADNTVSVTQDQYDALVNGSQTSLSPDSGSTLPAPLDGATDYYVYKYGTDTATEEGVEVLKYLIQFSTTESDGQQGTDIVDLTDAGAGTFSMDLGDIFSTLGLPKTAQPGSDAVVTVNGRTSTESPGVFTQDEGRLILEAEDNTATPLPLKVVKAVDGLEAGMAEVTASYNQLINTLRQNPGVMEPGFADQFIAPLAKNAQDLKWLGLQKMVGGEVYFNADLFYTAVGENPDQAENVLMSESGLVPSWQQSVDEVLRNGTENYQAGPTPEVNIMPGPQTETELEKNARLVDTLDTLPTDYPDAPLGSPSFFDLKG